MNKFLKVVASGLLLMTVGSVTLPSINAFAETSDSSILASTENVNPVTKDGYRLFLIDGKMVEWPADLPAPTQEEMTFLLQQRGPKTAIAKKILKIYNKVPPKVRNIINKYLGIRAIAQFLDHFTGFVEDGVYRACRNAGMPDDMARLVAKTLTFLAL